jgi:hypothetical protein
MPDITHLAEEHEKRQFKIETEKYGAIQFDTLVAWRAGLILEKNNELEQMPPDEFCLNVAKCMLLDFSGVVIDRNYYKKIKKLSELAFEINSSELKQFAESFIKNNQESVLDNFSQEQIDALNDFEIIKKYFVDEKKRYDSLIKSITGFESVNLTPKIFSGLNAISEIKQLFPPQQESNIPVIHDSKLETLVTIEKSLAYYSELIKLSNECLNQINDNTRSQIESAEKNSKEAKWFSTAAIIIAALALVASITFGVIQTSLSYKANIQTQELNTSIKNLKNAVDETNLNY